MPIYLHIERYPKNATKRDERLPIPLEEWKAAVQSMQGVRLISGPKKLRDPLTGEEVVMPSEDGEAEVLVEEMGEWVPVFWWSDGCVKFSANMTLDSVWKITKLLAEHLNALVVGEEGGIFDMETGEEKMGFE